MTPERESDQCPPGWIYSLPPTDDYVDFLVYEKDFRIEGNTNLIPRRVRIQKDEIASLKELPRFFPLGDETIKYAESEQYVFDQTIVWIMVTWIDAVNKDTKVRFLPPYRKDYY